MALTHNAAAPVLVVFFTVVNLLLDQQGQGATLAMTVHEATSDSFACPEWERLLGLFLTTIEELIAIEAERQNTTSVLRRAERKKARAKHALLLHLETHPTCGS